VSTKSQALIIGAAVAAIAGVLYAVSKFLDFNKGTPYEGAGAIGTLGNATNQILGGAPAAVGSAIGTTLYNLTHSDQLNLIDYTFTFVSKPSARGVVAADLVDEDTGIFEYRGSGASKAPEYNGKRFRLKKDKTGAKFAEGPL
jgi:hypothetical protein